MRGAQLKQIGGLVHNICHVIFDVGPKIMLLCCMVHTRDAGMCTVKSVKDRFAASDRHEDVATVHTQEILIHQGKVVPDVAKLMCQVRCWKLGGIQAAIKNLDDGPI